MLFLAQFLCQTYCELKRRDKAWESNRVQGAPFQWGRNETGITACASYKDRVSFSLKVTMSAQSCTCRQCHYRLPYLSEGSSAAITVEQCQSWKKTWDTGSRGLTEHVSSSPRADYLVQGLNTMLNHQSLSLCELHLLPFPQESRLPKPPPVLATSPCYGQTLSATYHAQVPELGVKNQPR